MAPNNKRSSLSGTPQQQQRSIASFFTPNNNRPSLSSPPKRKKPLLVISSEKRPPLEQPQCTPHSPAVAESVTPNLEQSHHSRESPHSGVDTSKGQVSSPRSLIGKRLKVFWPLDQAWYEGCVTDFVAPNHVIKYDDGEEETLCLEKEKVEWLLPNKPLIRKLRKLSFSKASSGAETGTLLSDTDGECLKGPEGIVRSSKRSHKAGQAFHDRGVENENSISDSTDDDDVEEDAEWTLKSGIKSGYENSDFEVEDDVITRPKRARKALKQESSRKGTNNSLVVDVQNRGSKVVNEFVVTETAHNGKGHGIDYVTADSLVHLTGEAAERFGSRDAEKFKFLGKDRKDASGRQPCDPGYDPRTLYLPRDFIEGKGLPPGQRQWWELKSKHMDKVLLFKMGKFYEMFEMDAHIGVQALDLLYMKGGQPHCGFPEKNFEENAGKLARMGYRVVVVEQVETPAQMLQRNKKFGTRDKVVKREICGVISKGIITEGDMLLCTPDAVYLMTTFEILNGESSDANPTIGLCFLDAATSRFMVGQFSDDLARSRLRSILSELRPVELVKPAGLLSTATEKALKETTRDPLVTSLTPGSEFWDLDRTLGEVIMFYGEKSGKKDVKPSDTAGLQVLPDLLQALARAGRTARAAICALGGCISFLRQALLDQRLLSSGRFELLPCSDPFLEVKPKNGASSFDERRGDCTSAAGVVGNKAEPYMILDSSALENLDILENSHDRSTRGTLLAQLDHCVTAFGRRLLKQWVVRPLTCIDTIVDRQNAIEDMKGIAADAASRFRKELLKLPDMERLVVRLKACSERTGRNAQAVVLYEDTAKKLLKEFLSALRGFETINQVLSLFKGVVNTLHSHRLRSLLTLGDGIQELPSTLEFFRDAFDWSDAEKTDHITPHEGVDQEFDLRLEEVKAMEEKLDLYLKEQREYFQNQSIGYVTVGKDRFQLEIPDSLHKKVPTEYNVESQRKGFRRYTTAAIKKLLGELVVAEENKGAALKNILQGLLARFCEHYNLWLCVVWLIAELDALISLAFASNCSMGPTCRPRISTISVPSGSSIPLLLAKGLRHPILESNLEGGQCFVPNDINLGGKEHPPFMLLTGPNMGGKSTLLRQVCLAVILAQVGADVPAEDFHFSPIDRVFVRMGAKDHIMTAQSTFLVELLETSSMLTSATRHSLVALDELGRGTATSDGQAIAHAVLEHFAHDVGCLGMFSTHYHRLANDHLNDPMVSLNHMACRVEHHNKVEKVTFLYRLASGACPKSYGVNVARIAGMPESVMKRAVVRSAEMESVEGSRAMMGQEELLFLEVLKMFKSACSAECVDLGLMARLQERWRSIHDAWGNLSLSLKS